MPYFNFVSQQCWNKGFCPSNLSSSARLDGQKQSFLFSWDLKWPPSDKGLLSRVFSTLLSVFWNVVKPQAPQAQNTWCMRQLMYIENSLYIQAVAYTTYFELGEPVVKHDLSCLISYILKGIKPILREKRSYVFSPQLLLRLMSWEL